MGSGCVPVGVVRPRAALKRTPRRSLSKVLVRADLNVPLTPGGGVGDENRIRASLPTLQLLIESGARVVVMSHLGRPKGGKPDPSLSLAPVAARLEELLTPRGCFQGLVPALVGPEVKARVDALGNGQVLLLENTRFHPGDEAGDELLAKQLADLADVYICDAFGAAHRDHASVSTVARFVPVNYPGLLLRKARAAAIRAAGAFGGGRCQILYPLSAQEVRYLTDAMWNATRPLACVTGGAKARPVGCRFARLYPMAPLFSSAFRGSQVSDKIGVLLNLVRMADVVLIGGRMAFTFLAAQGIKVRRLALRRVRFSPHPLVPRSPLARSLLRRSETRSSSRTACRTL